MKSNLFEEGKIRAIHWMWLLQIMGNIFGWWIRGLASQIHSEAEYEHYHLDEILQGR